MDDADLAMRARSGDTAAFSVLVARHEARVRRFVRRAAVHEADDIAQEAFLKAWQRRAAWNGSGSYLSWLMRIAWTTYLDHSRSARRRSVRETTAEAARAPAHDPELALALAQALAALSPQERASAELCLAQGFSHGEAAAILELPLGTLKSSVARARARLIALLEDYDD
jgi:RNA polymerase sigma-70 factor (ECF subfamily)